MKQNLPFKNSKCQIIVSSGPFTDDLQNINKLFMQGIEIITTKTITYDSEKYLNKIFFGREYIFNKSGFSNKSLEDWLIILKKLKNRNVIVSIFDENPILLSELAVLLEKNNVKVIELCLSCPTLGYDPICFDIEKMTNLCKMVRKCVSIPIYVKLLATPSKKFNRKMVQCAIDCGIDGITISDTIPAIILDDNKKYMFGGAGGISGPFLKPIVLKFLDDIRDMDISIIATGGVENANDVS